jgi:hypothetical protein
MFNKFFDFLLLGFYIVAFISVFLPVDHLSIICYKVVFASVAIKLICEKIVKLLSFRI